MRDPARIQEVLDRIGVAWRKYPDFRLGQLIEDATAWHGRATYNVEDEALLEAIEVLCNKIEDARMVPINVEDNNRPISTPETPAPAFDAQGTKNESWKEDLMDK